MFISNLTPVPAFLGEDPCTAGVCEQNCTASSDSMSFDCGCDDGYILNEDLRTCRGGLFLMWLKDGNKRL